MMEKRQPEHPLENVGFLSRANLHWVFKELEKSKKRPYQEDDLYPLPREDKLLRAKENLQMEYRASGSLMLSIWRVYKWWIIWLLFLSVVSNFLMQSGPYVLGLVVKLIFKGNLITEEEKQMLGIYFVYLVVSTLIIGMILNYSEFTMWRVAQRISGGVSLMIFDKIGRINVLNKTTHSTGNILNYIQSDAQKFQTNLGRSISILSSLISLAMGIYLLYGYVYNLCWIILGTLFLGNIGSIYIYKKRLPIIQGLQSTKDKRIQLLTNVISNIKFVKIKGWENFFHYKVGVKRAKELKSIFHLMLFNSLNIFYNWSQFSACQIAFVVGVTYMYPEWIELSRVSATLSILKIFFDAQMNIPFTVGQMVDFRVSLVRVRDFLQAEELKADLVKYDLGPQSEYAITLKDGDFFWQTPENEDDVKQKDGKKKAKKISNDKNVSHNEDSLLETSLEVAEKGVAFRIYDLNIKIKKGSLIFIIGKVGSGKSSLLFSLLGEMKTTEGAIPELHSNPNLAFLSQTPWLLSDSIKRNIVLDLPVDTAKLDRALRLSQLAEDIKSMPGGLETSIGENGSAVSGGQRTRIALARIIYQDPDVIIMDDPLSALDLKVADRIMKEAFCGELKDKTRIITTHAVHNIRYADYIYVMDHGRIVFEGTYDDMEHNSIYQEFREVTQSFNLEDNPAEDKPKDGDDNADGERKRKLSLEEVMERKMSNEGIAEDKVKAESSADKEKEIFREMQTQEISLVEEVKESGKDTIIDQLFLQEDKVQGTISMKTISTLISEIGGYFPIFLIMLSTFSSTIANFLGDFYHLEWARNFDPENKTEYMWLLVFLLVVRCVITSVRSLFVFGTELKMSRNIHAKMMFRILHAKITEFLERVPAGRIINRFSRDIEVLDRDIGWSFNGFYLGLAGVVVNMVVLIWTVGWTLVAPIVLFLVGGVYIQRKLMQTKREVVRLEGVSRSPVAEGIQAMIRGAPEIRVLKKLSYVRAEFMDKFEVIQQNGLLKNALDAWYLNNINILNVFLIQVPGFMVLSYSLFIAKGELSVEKVVMFILRSLEISGSLMGLLTNISQLETQLISVERCSSFSQIEPEARYLNIKQHENKYLHAHTDKDAKQIVSEMNKYENAIIPSGEVRFISVTAKYPTKPTPVLSNLNLYVRPGEKIGIVGRTGAGKTSLIKLFWMCLEPTNGKVIIDGRNVMNVDLKVLRSNMDIISQETAIFEGTLRENLDPRLEYLYDKNSAEFKARDKELLKRLCQIGFKEETLDGQGLDYPISSGGDNLSLGQKQLICFMRVLFSPKKLMILDEATANIDLKTEKLMSDAVKHEFKQSTMFIIAHRIQTVLDCDKICIMDKGQIVEFDTPKELIKRPGSIFAEIYQKLLENNHEGL